MKYTGETSQGGFVSLWIVSVQYERMREDLWRSAQSSGETRARLLAGKQPHLSNAFFSLNIIPRFDPFGGECRLRRYNAISGLLQSQPE
jgi:hypothetical protein